MMNWDGILLESKRISPWLEDLTTAEADWCCINRYGLPVCEVAAVSGDGDAWAYRVLLGEWTIAASKDEAMVKAGELAARSGFGR